MGVGRVAPAVALLLLLGQTHAYVGRAAKFLRKRVARRGRGGGAVSPPPNAPSDAPTPAPLPSLDTAAPRLSRRATSQAARPGIDGPDPLLLQVTPLAEHGPLDGLWNIYDQFVESIASSGKHVLSGKTPTEHYPDPTNVFVTSSALRQCGDTDTCSMGAEGSFDVVRHGPTTNSSRKYRHRRTPSQPPPSPRLASWMWTIAAS
mmetsp:Transcript_29171/g.93391  ORF Transcript_29171/g.93391 Transcript_29171/m.93391 type:complete len:204 (+) Transcript_29171:180-791(+)